MGFISFEREYGGLVVELWNQNREVLGSIKSWVAVLYAFTFKGTG